jgi:hypothetical protein
MSHTFHGLAAASARGATRLRQGFGAVSPKFARDLGERRRTASRVVPTQRRGVGHGRRWRLTLAFAVIVVALLGTGPAQGQAGAKKGEWPTYGGDLGHTRYAPLDQINAANFKNLEVAWRFKTESLGPRPEFNFDSTPLMVNGMVLTLIHNY